MITTEELLMTNVCLHFVNNGPGVKFMKFATLLLVFSYNCCIVDIISFVRFLVMIEIARSFPLKTAGNRLLLYDTSVYQMNSLSLFYCSQLQYQYTILQGLPLEKCALLLLQLGVGLLATLQHDAFSADQKRPPKQSVLQLHSFFPLCRKFSCI